MTTGAGMTESSFHLPARPVSESAVRKRERTVRMWRPACEDQAQKKNNKTLGTILRVKRPAALATATLNSLKPLMVMVSGSW